VSDPNSRVRGRPVAFGHVGLQVRDLDKSLVYYKEIIGLVEIDRQVRSDEYLQQVTGYAGVELDIAVLMEPRSGALVELLEYRRVPRMPVDPATANPGTAHICFEVDDVDEIYARVRAAGERAVSAPVTPGSGRWSAGRSVYLIDPDGIRVELVQRSTASLLTQSAEIEPVYLVEAVFAAGADERRKPHRPAHLQRIADLKRRGIVVEGGAYLDNLSTSIMLIRANNETEARQIAEDDIYVKQGIWESVTVRPFGRVAIVEPPNAPTPGSN
jgi:catechol 2,3-dioxygenase-like lactoylglutathione lyase family enzyme/uncharacterized protein YciI